jgi:Protein of unknown function (DUF3619)
MKSKFGFPEEHTVEARLAATIAGSLSVAVDELPHDIATRLRFAREQAVARAGLARRQAAAGGVIGRSPSGVATLGGGFVPWWQRVAAVVPLLTLVAGLLLIDHWAAREQVVAAADFDAQLLADALPPSAYTDAGFAEYLKSSQP